MDINPFRRPPIPIHSATSISFTPPSHWGKTPSRTQMLWALKMNGTEKGSDHRMRRLPPLLLLLHSVKRPPNGFTQQPVPGASALTDPPHLSARKTARKNVNANSQASRNSGRNDSKSRSWRRGGRWRWWSGKAFSPKPSPPLPPPPWWYPTSHTHTERDIEKDGERESKRGRGRGKDVICFTWKNGAEQPCEKNLNPETGTKTRLLCFFVLFCFPFPRLSAHEQQTELSSGVFAWDISRILVQVWVQV